MSAKYLNRLIENSFPEIDQFFEKIEVEFESLEHARSFWSQCFRAHLKPKNGFEFLKHQIHSPLFIKIPTISTTNCALDSDNEDENTKILLKLTEREVKFLNDFRGKPIKNFPIPRNFMAEPIRFSKSTTNIETGGLVFEDVGGFSHSLDFVPGFSNEQIFQILNALAAFHSAIIEKSSTIDWSQYNNTLYDQDYFKMMYNDTLDIEMLRPELFKGKIEQLESIYDLEYAENIYKMDKNAGMPEILAHNDLNSSNILWDKNSGKISAIIDFQHLARGPLVTDIIRVLSLGLGTKCRRENEERYLKHYYNSLSNNLNGSISFSFEQLEASYRRNFALVNATTLFGCYYYYKMYKIERIELEDETEKKDEKAEEILVRALAIIEDILDLKAHKLR